MDSDAHVQRLEVRVLTCLSNFTDYVDHLEADFYYSVSLIDLDLGGSSVFRGPARVTHNHIAVTDRVYFINLMYIGQLVEFAK